MKRTRFTEEQMLRIVKEGNAGMPVKELCRKHGIHPATFYNWKSKLSGMEISDVKKLNATVAPKVPNTTETPSTPALLHNSLK